MNYWIIIAIPVTSALIGWITNLITIRVLFHPRKPKNFLGFRYQGIIPGRQQQFSEKLGNVISKEFFSNINIEKQINDPANLQKIIPIIENHIDDFLRNKLAVEIPMVSMFVGDKTIGIMKQAFMKEFELLFPVVIKQYALNLKDQQNPGEMITQKIASFSSDKLEKTIYQNLSKELRSMEVLGSVIGFIIGAFVSILVLIFASVL